MGVVSCMIKGWIEQYIWIILGEEYVSWPMFREIKCGPTTSQDKDSVF